MSMTPSQSSSSPRKRKRQENDREEEEKTNDSIIRTAYKNVVLTPRKDTGEPATPHRFFASSFHVSITSPNPNKVASSWVVHRHVNGLCVVTVGDEVCLENVRDFQLCVQPNPKSMSQGEKRKLLTKLLKKYPQEETTSTTFPKKHIVTPTTVVAQWTSDGETTHQVYAGVWGLVLEVNTNLTPSLLRKDPLLDGFLCIVLPTGPFPPRECMSNESHSTTLAPREDPDTSATQKGTGGGEQPATS